MSNSEEHISGPGVAAGREAERVQQANAAGRDAYVAASDLTIHYFSPGTTTDWVNRLLHDEETSDRIVELVRQEQELEKGAARTRQLACWDAEACGW